MSVLAENILDLHGVLALLLVFALVALEASAFIRLLFTFIENGSGRAMCNAAGQGHVGGLSGVGGGSASVTGVTTVPSTQ